MKKICTAIGIEVSVTTYTARHTFSTVLKRSGVTLALIECNFNSKLKPSLTMNSKIALLSLFVLLLLYIGYNLNIQFGQDNNKLFEGTINKLKDENKELKRNLIL